MATRTYTIDFYQGNMAQGAEPPSVSAVFERLPVDGPCPAIRVAEYVYEIREFGSFNQGASYRGALAAFRHDDLPHAGRPQGEERELSLAADEGLIEKTYFSYFRNQELLVIQRNRRGGGVWRLGAYLTDIVNNTVSFNPVLQAEPMQRLLQGGAEVRVLELTVARPQNPDLVPRNVWARNVLEVLSGASGMQVNLTVRGNSWSRQENERLLHSRVKRGIHELTQVADVKKAWVVVSEDGVEHPIDLIADRIVDTIEVELNGRYPNAAGIFRGLVEARARKQQLLNEVLGRPDNRLR